MRLYNRGNDLISVTFRRADPMWTNMESLVGLGIMFGRNAAYLENPPFGQWQEFVEDAPDDVRDLCLALVCRKNMWIDQFNDAMQPAEVKISAIMTDASLAADAVSELELGTVPMSESAEDQLATKNEIVQHAQAKFDSVMASRMDEIKTIIENCRCTFAATFKAWMFSEDARIILLPELRALCKL